MRLVVTPFIDDRYPDEVVFLALHLSDSDPATIAWNSARWGGYGPPGGGYIPQVVVGMKSDTYVGYPGNPPTPWIDRVEAQRTNPTDITMALTTSRVAGDQWRFTAQVCMEPTGTARTVRTYIGYTIDDWPVNPQYRYRATVRNVATYEDVALNPGDCVDVERDFTFQSIDLAHWETIVGVAWAQEPAVGFGEAYQATKTRVYQLLDDGFESGDLSGWSAVQP